jgi:NAD(P)-dependent dehydrogenase (short-subunit alcohol dehydrogenase family)
MRDAPGARPLTGRTALVTGAAGGIGAATVRQLEIAGATVLGVDADPSYAGFVGDVTDPDAMARAVAAAGELDICIANAGVSLMEPLLEGTPEGWERVIKVNLVGAMVTLQAAASAMVAHRRGGRLLAVASIAGLRGETHAAAYSASKAGVIGLVRALAVELARHDIAVNAVAPGQIDTGMNRRDVAAVSRSSGRPAADVLHAHLDSRVPARRIGTPEEVAAVLGFLASDAAAFITGEVICVDGGELAA